MLGNYHILMTYYLNSRVLGFSVVYIYVMGIIRYQLILLIIVKQCLHVAVDSMSIQLCHSGLRMHQLIFNITKITY